jgi:hypothetical protein
MFVGILLAIADPANAKISGGQKLVALIKNNWTRPLNLNAIRQSVAGLRYQESFILKADRMRSAS